MLSNIWSDDKVVIFRLITSTFLVGSALHLLIQQAMKHSKIAEAAIKQFEDHFLNLRARRANNDIWNALYYPDMRLELLRTKSSVIHKGCFGKLLETLLDLRDLRTGIVGEAALVGKLIAAVQKEEIFCCCPPASSKRLECLTTG